MIVLVLEQALLCSPFITCSIAWEVFLPHPTLTLGHTGGTNSLLNNLHLNDIPAFYEVSIA